MGVPESNSMRYYSVEGMHCVRCIRKIQSIGERLEGVSSLDVDLSENRITAEVTSVFDSAEFDNQVTSAGFKLSSFSETPKQGSLYKSFLMRIGVAGACAGNIMLISVSQYAGSGLSEVGGLLRWVNFAFFLPVLFFCSWPIFKNCLHSFKVKKVSVDLPLSIAILGASSISFYNLILGKPEVYFDSLAMFIFFLLSSRYIIFRLQTKYLSPVELNNVFSKDTFEIETESGVKKIGINDLKPGHKVNLVQGDFMPVDCELNTDLAEIDNSLITGESTAVLIQRYSKVFAGARLISRQAQILVKKELKNSRLTFLIEKINGKLSVDSPTGLLADRGAQYLTVATVFIALLASLYFYLNGVDDGLDRILALLVISCPCALAIATPLAHSLTVKRALEDGILFKSTEAMESFSNLSTFIFDKTGTLTTGALKVVDQVPEVLPDNLKNIIGSMEEKSEHPVGRALMASLGDYKKIEVKNFNEVAGKGIEASVNGKNYEIISGSNQTSKSVVVQEEGQEVGYFKVRDSLKPETRVVIEKIRSLGKRVYLLTGDQKHVANSIGKEVGFLPAEIFSNQSPEEKATFVERVKNEVPGKCVFIGDGINDALAMASADVSVSMNSSAEITFKSSKIHLLLNNLESLIKSFQHSKRCIGTIRVTLFLSFIYNLSFAALALAGLIGPLVAVIIMPLSSITVVLITLLSLRKGVFV